LIILNPSKLSVISCHSIRDILRGGGWRNVARSFFYLFKIQIIVILDQKSAQKCHVLFEWPLTPKTRHRCYYLLDLKGKGWRKANRLYIEVLWVFHEQMFGRTLPLISSPNYVSVFHTNFSPKPNLIRKSCQNYVHTKNSYVKMLMKLTPWVNYLISRTI